MLWLLSARGKIIDTESALAWRECYYHYLLITAHYSDVIMSAMASHITRITIVYSTVYSGADQRKHQSSALLAFVRWIHRSPVNSPHKGPVKRKVFSIWWRHHVNLWCWKSITRQIHEYCVSICSHYELVTHIYVREMDQHCFSYWLGAWSAQSRYVIIVPMIRNFFY